LNAPPGPAQANGRVPSELSSSPVITADWAPGRLTEPAVRLLRSPSPPFTATLFAATLSIGRKHGTRALTALVGDPWAPSIPQRLLAVNRLGSVLTRAGTAAGQGD
jgi:hypothetical protein